MAHSTVLPMGSKPGDYFENPRADLIDELPRPLGRVLDVGCGAGGVGRGLRARGSVTRLVGVEYVPEEARRAREVFDEVLVGDAQAVLAAHEPPESYDTVLCYDVLEHLYDPAAVLARLAELTRPGGTLQISIPNVRHWKLLRDVALRGTFAYELHGHRDSTHLRWFTRSDLQRLVEEAGWSVVSLTAPAGRPRRVRWLYAATGGRIVHFEALQWHVLATRR